MSGAVPAVAAVDWGTTRLRIWLLAGDATVLAERRSDEGMASAATEGFGAILERHLADMGAPADLPAIVCGMAGARQGWIEAPYVACPAHMYDILSGAVAVPGAARPVRIVPGVAQHGNGPPDVMRGEETQLAGIAPRIAHGAHSVCIPGTHSKWIHAASGAIEGFATFLTGELYALLSTASILRHSVGDGAASASNPAFRAWVAEALAEPDLLSGQLFRIRASSLLDGLPPADAASALSGLLIGAEIAAARRRMTGTPETVWLIASGPLAALYGAALGFAGLMAVVCDAEAAVRDGLMQAARRNFALSPAQGDGA